MVGGEEEECRGKKVELGLWAEEQLRHEEHLTQTRSEAVSAIRKRGWGGEPRRRAVKYWPEPVEAPEERGRLAVVLFLRRWRWSWREEREGEEEGRRRRGSLR